MIDENTGRTDETKMLASDSVH
uniref:Uncharacterized protein n=1 Tax=Arundo donax TaxID=35708 RepID=A0A0A9A3L8_ARUDO